MKKNYESLLVNVIRFQAQDIITASGVTEESTSSIPEEPKEPTCSCVDSCRNYGSYVYHIDAYDQPCTAASHTCSPLNYS